MEKTKAEPAPEHPLCFVISPFGAEGSDVRDTADKVLKHVITKALSGTYKVQRADEIAKPGLITVRVVERLLDAPLVIADLSDGNANVYYELAIRHAANKPVIHILTEGQDAPFDVKDMGFITYNLKDPDSIDKAQEKIRVQASAIEKGEKQTTPVQVAQIMAQTTTGGDAVLQLKMLQAVYNAIASLQQEVRETKEGVQIMENQLFVSSAPYAPLSSLATNAKPVGLPSYRMAYEYRKAAAKHALSKSQLSKDSPKEKKK
jgi:hypothetical protein